MTARQYTAIRPLLMPSSYAPHIGGVEQVVEQFARQLLTRGIRPLVVTNKWPKTLPAAEDVEGVAVRREVFRVPEPTVRQLGGWALTSASIRRRIVRDARRHGTTIVNLHCASSNTPYALSVARALRVPLVVSLHGELTADASRVYERSAYLRRQWRAALDAAALVTAPSQNALEIAERAYGRSLGERALVIRNGVDVELFTPGAQAESARRDVLAVGRLVRVKGFDVLLDAWQRLPADVRGPHRLVIAGDGPERGALEEQARRLAVSDIDFVGALDRRAVAERMRAAVLVAVPSRQESLGLVALEAMAAGAPVVATRSGGLPEIVRPGETGFLVDPDRPDTLADAIGSVLSNEVPMRTVTEAARRQARESSWTAYAETMLAHFERVAGR